MCLQAEINSIQGSSYKSINTIDKCNDTFKSCIEIYDSSKDCNGGYFGKGNCIETKNVENNSIDEYVDFNTLFCQDNIEELKDCIKRNKDFCDKSFEKTIINRTTAIKSIIMDSNTVDSSTISDIENAKVV